MADAGEGKGVRRYTDEEYQEDVEEEGNIAGKQEMGWGSVNARAKTNNNDNGNKQRERSEAPPRPAGSFTPRGGTVPASLRYAQRATTRSDAQSLNGTERSG